MAKVAPSQPLVERELEGFIKLYAILPPGLHAVDTLNSFDGQKNVFQTFADGISEVLFIAMLKNRNIDTNCLADVRRIAGRKLIRLPSFHLGAEVYFRTLLQQILNAMEALKVSDSINVMSEK